ncbi:MAG TPA: GGDEF domain-containing protein [Candidatus Methylomirabilis sp.]|nr:GGDEF domain-containing protein [Candidatus Methylomirabilis sp.]
MKGTRSEVLSAIKAMTAIVAITFIAELLIMQGLSYLGLEQFSTQSLFIDAVVLALVIAPPIYWLVLSPIHKEYEKRLKAEGEAEEMSRMAITDSLTRIMNRRGITVGLLDAMAQAERYRTPLTVAMADIDHFKQVNDTYGHEAGDLVLKDVAAILSDALRMPDKVGRYGGEEFLVILPHTGLTQARKIADRIRASVSKWDFDLGSKKIRMTISIGVCQFKSGEDLEQFLSHADKALYDAKKGGRNLVVARKVR